MVSTLRQVSSRPPYNVSVDEYPTGDVMHLDVLGKSIIVLSSKAAVSDLLDKRSATYSDRPMFHAFNL